MCSLDKGSVRGSRASERTPLHSLPSSNIILNEAAGGFPEVAGLEQNVLAEDRATVPRLRPGSLGGWGGGITEQKGGSLRNSGQNGPTTQDFDLNYCQQKRKALHLTSALWEETICAAH